MRKVLTGLLVFLLVHSAAMGAAAAPLAPVAVSADASGYRILLDTAAAAVAGLAVRGRVDGSRVSAQVSASELARLDRLGVSYQWVPIRRINSAVTQISTASPLLQTKPVRTPTRVAPATQVPWGMKAIYGDPDLTPSIMSGGRGVTVAVLDTGSVNHPDFTRSDGSAVITGCVDFSQVKSAQVEGSCKDGNGHGTHVTGTIAAAGGIDGKGIFGVAPQGSILSYKVLTDRGVGYADDIARAIRVAADRGANIISMSLGSATGSTLELDAIRYAVSKGVLVVAAAGNDGPEADSIGYPGAYAEAIAVAALNRDESVAYFSSRGISDGDDLTVTNREVELAAPGRDVLSTYNDGAYATLSGTSMATPHIAGLAAKLWQGSAGATRLLLRQAAGAHDIVLAEQVNNAAAGYDIASGYGFPQVQAASQASWSD